MSRAGPSLFETTIYERYVFDFSISARGRTLGIPICRPWTSDSDV